MRSRRTTPAPNFRALLPAVLLASALLPGCADRPATWTDPVTGMEFVLVPAGRFTMGSPPEELGREPGETLHQVRISRAFYLGSHEVTQGEWQRVMGSNPSAFESCGASCPVEQVSARDVDTFLARLERLAGRRYRLPSEAEWEYACRAGTKTPFATGETLSPAQANYDPRGAAAGSPVHFRGAPVPVGSFAPNAWGLHDLHGNVWEWTADPHCPYPDGPVTDPRPRCASELRAIRGGSWFYGADSARCALRYTHRPQDSGFSLGLRLARDP